MARPPIDAHWRDRVRTLAQNEPRLRSVKIARLLEQEAADLGRDDYPSEKSVRNIIKDHHQQPEEEQRTYDAWTLSEKTSADARVVLDVLTEITARTKGKTYFITRNEAKWILAVAAVAPDLPAFETYILARAYLLASEKGDHDSLAALTLILAFKPWQGEDAKRRYFDMTKYEGIAGTALGHHLENRVMAFATKMGTPTITITPPTKKEKA